MCGIQFNGLDPPRLTCRLIICIVYRQSNFQIDEVLSDEIRPMIARRFRLFLVGEDTV